MGLKLGAEFSPERVGMILKQVQDRAVSHGADVLRSEAGIIQEIAIQMAPVRTGNLEENIETTADDPQRGSKNRIEVEVYVDEDATTRRGFPYGMIMHEDQVPVGITYGLGKKSEEKNANSPYEVGGGYIVRAVQARLTMLRRRIREGVQRGVKSVARRG